MLSFEYEDRMKGIPLHDEEGTRKRPHFLRVVFSKPAIDAELNKLRLREWGSARPLIGVWLDVRTAEEGYILPSGGPDGYGQSAVLVIPRSRGIPMLSNDRDENLLRFDDAPNIDFDKLNAVMPEADVLLAGTLSITTNGHWNMIWRLHTASSDKRWALKDVTFDKALKSGLTRSALALSGNDP